ncbi:MAG: hypothetical protein EA381_20040 [Planctomycetaceae bacterium]|nr:MAG: hypothetical protein EA381_20040 [Planctomycetaceae bacterium]
MDIDDLRNPVEELLQEANVVRHKSVEAREAWLKRLDLIAASNPTLRFAADPIRKEIVAKTRGLTPAVVAQ